MDDLTALSETAGRPKRSASEAMSGDPSLDMLQPYPHVPSMSTLQGISPSSSGVSPAIGAYGMGSASPGPAYVPPYEWWPTLIGPGAGQPSLSESAATYGAGPSMVSPYSGLPSSLFTFDPTHLSGEFMQGVQPDSNIPGPSMSQYPPHPHLPSSHHPPHHPPHHLQ